MTRALILALLTTMTVAIWPPSPAMACRANGNGGAGSSSFYAHISVECPKPDPTVDRTGAEGTWHQVNLCNESACIGCPRGEGPAVHIWLEAPDGKILYEWFGCLGDAPDAPPLTDAMVANAFRRITLPASELVIQPPNGRTLVNFDTNFYTEPLTFDRTVRLLGHRVDLHITVHSYRWDFGDGPGLTSTEPGAAYPKLQITHNYLRKAVYWPSLDTTYTADFRVDGGPWRLVPGTVTIDGDPERLEAIEARPTLVG